MIMVGQNVAALPNGEIAIAYIRSSRRRFLPGALQIYTRQKRGFSYRSVAGVPYAESLAVLPVWSASCL